MLFLNIDLSSLQTILDIGDVAQDAMESAAANLTAATKAKIVELANEKLHTRRGMFLDGLSHFQVDDSTWCVNLSAKVRWIDDGMEAHSMLEDLLKSKKAKRSKAGDTYVVVPFQLNKTKQNMTPAQQSLLNTVKKELAKVGETPNRIETTSDGTPKLGLVRSLDIMQAPISTGALRIGRGPRGHVAQGPTGIPLLQGVRVYQKEMEGGKVARFLMTFRVASSKHAGSDRWQHPGTEPAHLMDDGLKWALETWNDKMMPGLISKIIGSLK